MTKYERLRKELLEACRANGHKTFYRSNMYYNKDNKRIIQTWTCKKCHMDATLDTKPLPNGIDISGEAIALNCKKMMEE